MFTVRYGLDLRSKPTGHYMYHQFNTQQFYILPMVYLCVLFESHNKQRLFPYILKWLVFITEIVFTARYGLELYILCRLILVLQRQGGRFFCKHCPCPLSISPFHQRCTLNITCNTWQDKRAKPGSRGWKCTFT